jgi:hypothetical protein
MPVLAVALLAWAPWLIAIGGGLYLGLRAVRALERRQHSDPDIADLRAEIARLEVKLAESDVEIARLRESEEFTSRLVHDRRGAGSPPTAS